MQQHQLISLRGNAQNRLPVSAAAQLESEFLRFFQRADVLFVCPACACVGLAVHARLVHVSVRARRSLGRAFILSDSIFTSCLHYVAVSHFAPRFWCEKILDRVHPPPPLLLSSSSSPHLTRSSLERLASRRSIRILNQLTLQGVP